MRKIYLFILLGYWNIGLGQTYSINVNYSRYKNSNPTWSVMGDNTVIFRGRAGNSFYSEDIQNYKSIQVNISAINGIDCDLIGKSGNIDILTAKLIQLGEYYGLHGCNGGVGITEFIPNNLEITSLKNDNCAGEQLVLNASPAGFPAEAYHWQYSLDNNNWIDVNLPLINGRTVSNNTPVLSASINEILGGASSEYFGETIYFRLGYTARPFSSSIGITYSSCSPIIKSIDYLNPQCADQDFQQLKVIFDSDLETGEKFDIMQVRENTGSSTPLLALLPNQTIDNLVDEHTNPPTFSYTFPVNKLASGTYHIEYEATKNNIPRALINDSSPNFQVINPSPLKFTVTPKTDVLCHGEEAGSFELTASGGTPPYFYILDNETEVIDGETIPKKHSFTSPYIIQDLKAGDHNIKVEDANGCIETL